MPINVDCQCFQASNGACLHNAAPRKLIGLPQCVLMFPPTDVRLKGCALQYPHQRPDGYPPPPGAVSREGSIVERKAPPNVADERQAPVLR